MLLPTPLGRLIAARRRALGLSLPQLARLAGMTAVGIGDVERGRRFSLSAAYWPDLAAALQVDVGEIAAAVMSDRVVQLAPERLPTEEHRALARALADLAEDAPHLSADEAAAQAVAVSRLRVAIDGGR